MSRNGFASAFFFYEWCMPERILITEFTLQKLQGAFPDIPTYPHVDTELLYKDDPEPFHVVLPIAEVGRVSSNGLEYDDVLVTAIAEQMQLGVGGIRGHIKDEELTTAYPVDAVHWIGHLRDGKTLYAKGYIPVGETRDDIRRKKARGGNVGTSIFGSAVRELSKSGTGKSWKARDFVLEQIDLAPSKRAALENRKGFVITKEMTEGEMPENVITSVNDVPEPIREQIIRESEASRKVQRLAEIEAENTKLKGEVAEMRQFASIVAEIRTVLGAEADIPKTVAEYHNAMTKLVDLLGIKEFANISVRVEEMHEQVAEFRQKAFDSAVDARVAELTKWDARTDDGKKKVEAFRRQFRKAVVAELKGSQEPEKIAEVSKKVWDEEFQPLGETVVAALAGPSTFIPGRETPATNERGEAYDEMLKENAKKFSGSKN